MKRMVSLLMCVVMLCGLFAAPVAAEATVTAYITISNHGQIVTRQDGSAVALAPIVLSDKEAYTLDDALRTAHDSYYEGGAEDGYDTYADPKCGLGLTKFWGDASGMLDYQLNGGTETVQNLSHALEDGDIIDVYLLKSSYPDTEAYTKFDTFQKEVYIGQKITLTLQEAGYDENGNPVFSNCADAVITVDETPTAYKTGADGSVTLSFDAAGEYLISAKKDKRVDEQIVPAITAPVCAVKVLPYPDACITVPKDAELFVGSKGKTHFVSFTELLPKVVLEDETTATYYFELTNKSVYNYRISREDIVTYAGKFTKTADFQLHVTEEMLKADGKSKTTVDRDVASNNGYNVADIFLNINPRGHLKLQQNETYQLVNLRSWEAVDSTTANYFIEPDYHYTVLREDGTPGTDVVTVDEKGLLTAIGDGTAIVLVTYDALHYEGAAGGPFFGAIWPENTGVFVVTVGAEAGETATGMTIHEGKNSATIKLAGDSLDAEHDVIYFAGETGTYTFRPAAENATVSVANPVISASGLTFDGFVPLQADQEGNINVPLTHGRNIVRVEQDGTASYQVITAKKVSYSVNKGEPVHPGDSVSVVFDTLYHPANKLAGVYNMNALPVYTQVSGYEGKLAGGLPAQYTFASNVNTQNVTNILKERNVWGQISYAKDAELTVPADYPYDTFTLSGGMLCATGFGDAYGNHRGITLTDGKAPNLTAEARLGWLGQLPDIEIPIVATAAALQDISLNTEQVKTDYYAGDSFDTTGLIVTAIYEDETTQLATNYTVTPQVLTADTEKVTVTYREKTATIDISVTEPKVSGISVTSAPNQTSYEEGEVFDPTGMVVTATYQNGKTKETTEYIYTPNRTLETSDTEVTVTYTGTDAEENLNAVTIPISVTAGSTGSSGSSTITVYFTLLGDKKHGEPSGEADTHTLNADNLDTWLKRTKVTVPRGSTVISAITKALSVAGIPYSNPDGNYITTIRGLGEFDNGPLSGWMYTLNDRYPTQGISEKTLKSGDEIVLHYTDDYTQEGSKITVSSGGGSYVASYTVKFAANGAEGISNQSIKEGNAVIKPADPVKAGYLFVGWFTDEACTQAYDFDTKVTGSFTLYAKWTEPAQQTPAFGKTTFADVSEDDWHYDSVRYVYENALMQGTDNGFEPERNTTRGMLVTILWRMEESPAAEQAGIYTDVPDGEWYADAVNWAAEKGIVYGINANEFAPEESLTREQLTVILYRYAQYQQRDTSIGENTNILSYDDFESISEYAIPAVQWGVGSGMVKGDTECTISPRNPATRAQLAAILTRYCEAI